MSCRVAILPLAQTDIWRAEQWYFQAEPRLGDEFLDAVGYVIGRIEENPLQFPIVWRDVRRALLKRFPYAIFYVIEPESVGIIDCFHGKRAPSRWMRRRTQ